MKNKIGKFVNAKKVALASAMGTALSAVGMGHCAGIGVNDANTQTQSIMKAIFNVLTIGGVVLIAVGLVTLIRIIISTAGGEQAQPGAIGKSLGMLLGGVVLAAAKWIVEKVTGKDPTELTIF